MDALDFKAAQELARLLLPQPQHRPTEVHFGVLVSNESNGTSTVQLAAASFGISGIRRLSHVRAIPGSVVVVLRTGPDYMVIGALSDGTIDEVMTKEIVFSAATGADNDATASPEATWPSVCTTSVEVPSWAKRAIGWARLGQIDAVTAVCNHQVRFKLDTLNFNSYRIRWDPADVNGTGEQDIILMGEVDCSTLAGTSVTMRTTADRLSGTGALRADGESTHTMMVRFLSA